MCPYGPLPELVLVLYGGLSPYLARQHLYYHFSRPDSDRLMLLVKIFAKLILPAVREASDLHATFAMADHPPA